MDTVLVTGGNIGNHVATQLADRGVRVRVLVRQVSPNAIWKGRGIEQVAGDLNNPDSLTQAFQGAKKFFSIFPLMENLRQMAVNTIEAAKRAEVEYIVRSSSMGAATDAPIVAARLHGQAEESLERSGIPHTIVRPTAFMQNYLLSAASIQAQSAFYMPQGDARIGLVDARDIAAVAVEALTDTGHEGKKYSLTGPEALSNQDVAEKLTRLLGTKIKYVNVTDAQAEESMRAGGMPEWNVRAMLELLGVARAGYMAALSPDAELALKRKPISFDGFLADHRETFAGKKDAPTGTR
jgi:uncharacterized protein YbjT (DUF2867 family)